MTRRLRILIVDDQPRARQSLRALLSTWARAGEIQEAANGCEAVQMTGEFQPDVVLMDVRMPEMDGLQASAAIKARWPQLKIIVLSMYAEHRQEALSAGADGFLGKGEASDRLLDNLSVWIQEDV